MGRGTALVKWHSCCAGITKAGMGNYNTVCAGVTTRELGIPKDPAAHLADPDVQIFVRWPGIMAARRSEFHFV